MSEPESDLDRYGNAKLTDFALRKDQESPGSSSKNDQETYKQGRVTGR